MYENIIILGRTKVNIKIIETMTMTAGTWSCEIMEFVKNGEQDQTNCWLDVEGEDDDGGIAILR